MTTEFSIIFNFNCFQLLKTNDVEQPSMVQINHQRFINHILSKEDV